MALPRRSVAEYVADYVSRRVPEEEIGWTAVQEHLSDSEFLKAVPWKYAEKKRDLGSLFHDLAEQIAAGVPVSVDVFEPEIRTYVEAFLEWVKTSQVEYEALECAVFSREHGYAGTMDAIVNLGGRKLVLDYKTGKDVYDEVALQLAAYARAEGVYLGPGNVAPMPAVDGAVVIHVTAEGYRVVPVEIGDAVWRSFRYVREVFRYQDEIAKSVLSEPMAAPVFPATPTRRPRRKAA